MALVEQPADTGTGPAGGPTPGGAADASTTSAGRRRRSWPRRAEDCRLEDLRAACEDGGPTDAPTASGVEAGIPIYEPGPLRAAAAGPGRDDLLDELATVLDVGPGVVVIRAAVDPAAVDAATAVFEDLIDAQRAAGEGGGDHYAEPGANDRVWNALEKLAVTAPGVFADYYRSDLLALAAEAWLGPDHQFTSQVNRVNPGGQAQKPHRDYHLGFMTEAQAARYPRHAHLLSPMLTLQGAVAHGAIPVESGATKLLPGSQRHDAGYLAWRRPDVIEYFEQHCVQLPLASGDAVFFNPALLHAAGTNRTTDIERIANLLQISSSMGRTMERIDRARMSLALHPVLQARLDEGWDRADIDRVIAASADGYPFPADLDTEQPIGSLTPPSGADRVRQALDEGWTADRLAAALGAS